ncbi:MAG TPA: GntR family transcriptional regulator [Stackebrandtia sp.]|uniref:GntR family transcriptional regulator n=1 Tax=Stackebrandtia sp. TaxID=2023065 RepID=UPI002D5B2F18|nr:GntR family transcriptional regulator [Stackebrandtia sp.]HZE39972.1 GntR family transcriptional regulator [Stackebrandtia sp.]
MPEHAYVVIAGDYARRIRSGELPPRTQLPSHAEIAAENVTKKKVSDIVVRKAIEMLISQGLVYSVRRRGVFVADQPSLIRISPGRSMEKAESTFTNESGKEVHVERELSIIPADAEVAQALNLDEGSEVSHVVTRVTESGQPVSISDTFRPKGFEGTADAVVLEETISDGEPPDEAHAEWLKVKTGDLVKRVEQRFLDEVDRPVMVSKVSYPRDRHKAMMFRMSLEPASPN